MQKFSGKITHIFQIEERGEYKSIKFRVEEITADQYPEACTFTKSAKGESQKWVDSFTKDYSVGDNVEVEYKLKSVVYNDKKTGEEKTFNDVVAGKTTKAGSVIKKPESVPQSEFNKVADANGLVQEPLPTDDDSSDLPF
jgi:hypothetical protein